MSDNRNSVLLEVDRSILENQLILEENKDDELDSLLPFLQAHEKDELPYKLVQPIQGMCIKVRTLSDEKVFVNICQTDDIPCPDLIDDAKLVEIWTSDEPANYRVPLSIGEGREDTDKSGQPCMVYDVAINTEFYKKIESNKLFRKFLINVALEGIQDKFKLEFDMEDFIILKNRKVMGKLQMHRIQQRSKEPQSQPKKPLIQEVASTSTSEEKKKSTKDSTTAPSSGKFSTSEMIPLAPGDTHSNQQPQYRIMREPADGDIECLVGEFKMTNVLSVREVTLDVGEDRIIVESRRRGYLVDIFVPHSINQEKTCAQFNRDTRILTVRMPVIAAS